MYSFIHPVKGKMILSRRTKTEITLLIILLKAHVWKEKATLCEGETLNARFCNVFRLLLKLNADKI